MIIHERTKTSRAVRDVERILTSKLKRIGAQIRKDPSFPNNVSFLRQKYGEQVQSAIQSAVQQAYMQGLNYVSEFEETPTLLSQKDIQSIQQKASMEAEGFWRAVTRDTINNQIPEATRSVNIQATSQLLAVASTTGALALATVNKTQEMDPEAEVTWITALDERVCPICRPLHKKTWKVNDPLLLKPIEHTHPNCRCRLILRDGMELFSR